MLTQLFSTKKKNAFAHLSFDIPVHHSMYMRYNKLKMGESLPHKDIEQIFGRTKNLQTNVLYGQTSSFLFIARGEEMIEHILKTKSVPTLRHPAILIHYPLTSIKLLKKRVEYFNKHDKTLISFEEKTI
ncbi:MAG: hypothetical protein Q8934_23055 [Bacillota bacterium]|nr:hypothetical protein [Bacillota bacterium]